VVFTDGLASARGLAPRAWNAGREAEKNGKKQIGGWRQATGERARCAGRRVLCACRRLHAGDPGAAAR